MPSYALDHVADETLLADLSALVSSNRQTTAALLAHIGEVDARGLYLPAACSSMFVYCTRVLHLAEDAAYKRIRAARAARKHPVLFDAIADGRLHLSGVVLLAPHLTDGNVDEVVAEATHRSKAEIEVLVARLAPRPDLPDAISPIASPPGSAHTSPERLELAPGPVAGERVAPPPAVKPLSPERFGLQVTISKETHDKLERAKALLRHRNPSGDLATIFDRALDALLHQLEKEKFRATSRPRAPKPRREGADPHYVPNDVVRQVHARDDEQCAFVSETGERCTERGFLELDHRTPVALGGKSTVEEVRWFCTAHNQYEADRRLGAEFMKAKRNDARSRRAAARAARAAEQQPADAANPIESDVASALLGLGFKPAETRRAMENTALLPANTFEERIRAALAELARMRRVRCSEGPILYGVSSTRS